MGKAELIKESLKKVISMGIMVLIFVIAILALYFSSLLIGHQETLKTSSGEVIYVDNSSDSHEPAGGTTIVQERDDNLKVRQVTPVSGISDVIY